MAKDKVIKSALESGKWGQCSFCRQALPFEWWREQCLKGPTPTKVMEESYCILPNGLCSYCEANVGHKLQKESAPNKF